MSVENKSKEIDLIEVCLKLYLLFKRNIIILLVFLIAGLGLGIHKHLSQPTIFKAYLIGSAHNPNLAYHINDEKTSPSFSVPDFYFAELITIIKRYIILKDNIKLANYLNISPVDAEKINNISITLVDAEENIHSKKRIRINLDVEDINIIPNINTGLISFLKNAPSVKEQVEGRKIVIKELIAEIDKILSTKFDSNIDNILLQPKGNKAIVVVNNPYEAFLIKEKRMILQKELKTLEAFYVFTKFSSDLLPIKNSALKTIVSYGLIFFFIGAGILVLLKTLRFLRSYIKY